MTARIQRLLLSLIFALLAAGITLIVANAQTGSIPSKQTASGSSNCAACHTEFETSW